MVQSCTFLDSALSESVLQEVSPEQTLSEDGSTLGSLLRSADASEGAKATRQAAVLRELRFVADASTVS